MKESDIQKQIMEYLESRGVYCWKNFTTGIPDKNIEGGYRTNPNSGMADIMGVLPDGRLLCIEVKKKSSVTKKSRLQKQLIFLNRIDINNGIAFFAYSLQDVTDKLETTLLDRIDKEKINTAKN